jgi:U3 small nucleolar RNA-associated protein 21
MTEQVELNAVQNGNTTTKVDSGKKTKLELVKQPKNSRLFQPFKALGYICNEVPIRVQNRGQAFFITSAIGNHFHIYDVSLICDL